MKTLRHTLTTLSLALTTLLTPALTTGCQDDPLFSAPGYDGETTTKADMTNPGPLQRGDDGLWRTNNQRVPLVGAGRVVNSFSQAISIDERMTFDEVVDLNIDNYTEIPSAVKVTALGENMISVKDLYRTYAGGQTVGFVIENGGTGELLNANLLKFFVISVYRDSKLVKSYNVSESSGLLNVGVLGSSSAALQTVSVRVGDSYHFDEVRLGLAGVDATVLSWKGMKIHYAFVGETPMVDVTSETYPHAEFEDTKGIGGLGIVEAKIDALLDPDYTEGIVFTDVVELGQKHETTLNFGQEIPAGTEIGFRYREGKVLNLTLFPTLTLTPQKADGTPIEADQYQQTGLLGLGLIGGGEGTYSVMLSQDAQKLHFNYQNGGVDVGASALMRAYTRAPIEIDPTSYFTAPDKVVTSASAYIFMNPLEEITQAAQTKEGSTGQPELTGYLMNNPGGKAQLDRSIELPDGTTPYRLWGMQENTTYVVEFIYKTSEGKEFKTTTTVTRTPGAGGDCEVHYMTEKDGFKTVEGNNVVGINIITTSKDWDNITDGDNETYATITNLAELTSVGAYAVVASDKGMTVNKATRVGFTISNDVGLLGLQALKFFTIALYDESGNKITSNVSSSNNGVSLDLIHIANKATTRVSIEVGPGTAHPDVTKFKYIALETVNILDVNLSEFRIYNAFYEDASCEENSVMEECSQLFTYTTNNLEIDGQHMGSEGISIVSVAEDLGNMIDDDPSTAATFYNLANVGDIQVGLTFREQQNKNKNTWLGLLIQKPTGLLTANLLNKVSVRLYYKGSATGDEITVNSGLLGVDLMGSDEKTYIEVYPEATAYDGIVVTFGGIGANQKLKVFGLYGTKDLNGNGTSDCEEEDQTPPRSTVTIEDMTLCDDGTSSDGIEVSPVVTLDENINLEADYWLEWINQEGESRVIPVKIQKGSYEYYLVATDPTTDPLKFTKGYYTLRLYNGAESEWGTDQENKSNYEVTSGSALLTIYPNRTTWTGAAGDHSWTNWSNWDEGTPGECTDVIIRGNLGDNYPILLKTDYDAGLNNCARIHIEDGGQIVNTQYLNTYEGAWVDVKLQGGRYYMLASPLEDMVSGDWFISETALATSLENTANGLPYFSALNEVNYPEGRINPTIYQRLWSTSAPVKNPDGYNSANEVMPDETQWTPPYNAVGQLYGLGMGFSLMAGKESNGTSSYLFRFPKLHHTYHYYNLVGTVTGSPESIERKYNYGKFIGEDKWTDDGKLTVSQTNDKENSYFLIGNPFVCHLNLSAFMAANGITEVKLFDSGNNTNNSLILIDGELVSNADGYVRRNIKPMEAFFVRTRDGAATTTINVDFTRDMLTSESGSTGGSATTFTRSAPSALPASALRLTAALGGTQSHALLRVSPDASAGAVPGEDTRLLIEGEARPAVAVYTVADGQALDIQQVPDGPATIPLGFYLRDGGKADIRLTLDFTGSQWTDWFLVDQRTGQRRRITHTTLTLHDVENGSGQYALMKN